MESYENIKSKNIKKVQEKQRVHESNIEKQTITTPNISVEKGLEGLMRCNMYTWHIQWAEFWNNVIPKALLCAVIVTFIFN